MEYITSARILRGVGGLYLIKFANAAEHNESFPETVSPLAGRSVLCRARGSIRGGGKLMVGDLVRVSYTHNSFEESADGITLRDDTAGLPDCAVCALLPRKNALIRPPLANLDFLFILCASAAPAPAPETIDKLLSVAEYHSIEAAIIIGKNELDSTRAEELKSIYTLAGYPVFSLSCVTGDGVDELKSYLSCALPDKIAAFAGASGVGKSTLMSRLFPSLSLETGEISRRTERGKHTTRQAELFCVELENGKRAYLADTPGFSLVDFENFDFLPFSSLPDTMRDFAPYLGKCRYDDCTHTKDEGCAVLDALAKGEISPSRHQSYLSMYQILKAKKPWEK
jgi:ribosome biogenesis GTPase